VQALLALPQADAVVHDALISAEVLELLSPSAERIYAGKRGGKPSIAQEDICAQMVRLAQAGRRVIRLKGGDPYVFGRGGEEILCLAEAGIPFRVLPGLTAGLTALTAAAIPATIRGINQSLILMTGHAAEMATAPNWKLLAQLGEPIVLYMALNKLSTISTALTQGGLKASTPVAVISNVGAANERVLVSTLETVSAAVEAESLPGPAIVVVGEIVNARATLFALQASVRK
jgi:uroporphyrin-III C-methyltransferase